jgi:photosystem II stability/assembly factor-like uncharacterized protein
MKKKIILTISIVFIGVVTNAQWQQTSLDTGQIRNITLKGTNIFAGESINYGSSGKVFLSTDEGNNWTDVFSAPRGVMSIAESGTNIYAGTYGGGIFLSDDNGGNWTPLTAGPNNVTVLAAVGTNIFAGTDASLFYSLDNGTSWNPSNVYMYDVLSLDISGVNVFAGTHLVGVFLSNDNGTTWNSKGLTNQDICSLVSNATNLFAGTGDTIYLSNDLGTNWIPVFNPGFICRALAAVGTNIFAGTEGGGVFLSTNNGLSWSAVNQGLTAMNVRSIAIGDSNVFLGTDNDGVWKRPLSQLLTGIDDNPNSNVQVTIYPNPLRTYAILIINPAFKVINAELKIYNLMGQESKDYINISNQPLTIERSNLINGIYFYKLTQKNIVIAKGKLIVE